MSPLEAIDRAFFDRNAKEVAPDLVGCLLVRRDGRALRVGRIVETEAYVGEHDLACHARMGRTKRNEVMYGEPGHAYVYFIYGMHPMLNVVCGPGFHPSAVLIRAAEPVESLLHSSIGPGNLTKALNIKMDLNRADLCDDSSPLYLSPKVTRAKIWRSPRVGVDYAGKWARALLRFADRDSAFVSRPTPPARSARRPRRS